MKVLITGGYGFIGSHVAEKLFKEGYEIVIIDNLSTGKKENVSITHKFYDVNISDKRCEEIFNKNKFDIVIHLASNHNKSMGEESTSIEAMSSQLGLMNMLQLSSIYGIKKFLFASTTEVYGECRDRHLDESSECNPVSTFGINKFIEEFFCSEWSNTYGLETVCLRFSNVFGARQIIDEKHEDISSLIDKAVKNEEFTILYDGEYERNYIYIEDLVAAVYKCVIKKTSSVLNLSSNNEVSKCEILDTINRIKTTTKIIYIEPNKIDNANSSIDNSRAKKELDWNQIYSFESGIKETLKWSEQVDKKNTSWILMIKATINKYSLLPYLENMSIFLAALILVSFQNVLNLELLDFGLIYIILVGVFLGIKQSLISIPFSIFLFLFSRFLNGESITYILIYGNTIFHIFANTIVGLSVSYTLECKNRQIRKKDLKIELQKRKYESLDKGYKEIVNIKNKLHDQIINYKDSFGKIYEITERLDSLDTKEIYNASIEVLEDILKSDSISVYALNRSGIYLRLVAKSKNMEIEIPKSYKISDSVAMTHIMEKNEMFINFNLEANVPMMVAPVKDMNNIVAVVCIHELDFENMTLYFQNLFNVIVGLISSSLSRAYKYSEATYESRYLKDTMILNNNSYEKVLEIKRQSNERINVDFTMLRVETEINYSRLSKILSMTLREFDYCGIGNDGNVYIILNNSDYHESDIAIERLKENGVYTRIVSEELIYDDFNNYELIV